MSSFVDMLGVRVLPIISKLSPYALLSDDKQNSASG